MRVSLKESDPNNTAKILDNNKHEYRIFLVSLLKILQKHQSKRAVAEIIVRLLLVAITAIGGIIRFVIVKDSGIAESLISDASQPLTFEGGLALSAYDTRDGADLMGITTAPVDNSPTTDGKLKANEFIVLKITNNSPNSIFLNGITVNEISHTFDTAATLPPASGGTFCIIPGDITNQGTTPQTTSEIEGGKSVNIVVKLGSISDISIGDAIRVAIDVTGFDLQNFIITAGNAR